MKCRICNNSDHLESYEVREMMFGLRESFIYLRCPDCGCLQIAEIPSDMLRYYPEKYYSFGIKTGEKYFFKAFFKRLRDRYAITGQGISGRILSLIFPPDMISIYSGLHHNSSVLDVGCGTGELIYRLKEAGLNNVTGIDPYNTDNITYANGLVVLKKTLADIDGKWDLITYNHSFEHIAAPFEELVKVRRLLSDMGTCIIRIPVADSRAWEHYKTDWVQIDAPRHFYLHTKKSLGILAEKAGLVVKSTEYDSTAFQFWGSEQYKKNIPLYDKRSFLSDPGYSIFKRGEIKAFKKRAAELNRLNKGDQAIFWLKKNIQAVNA